MLQSALCWLPTNTMYFRWPIALLSVPKSYITTYDQSIMTIWKGHVWSYITSVMLSLWFRRGWVCLFLFFLLSESMFYANIYCFCFRQLGGIATCNPSKWLSSQYCHVRLSIFTIILAKFHVPFILNFYLARVRVGETCLLIRSTWTFSSGGSFKVFCFSVFVFNCCLLKDINFV